jgi:putative transposase
LNEAEADVLAYLVFPTAHWRLIWSTTPLERLNTQLKHRTNVVGKMPTTTAIPRQVGALLAEQQGAW